MTTRVRDDHAMTMRRRGENDHAKTTTRPPLPVGGWRGRRRGRVAVWRGANQSRRFAGSRGQEPNRSTQTNCAEK